MATGVSVSRFQVLLVKHALLSACALLTVTGKVWKTRAQYSPHLLVRLPGISITAAVQQVPLGPPRRISLCSNGRYIGDTVQCHLEPHSCRVTCYPGPAPLQPGVGCLIIEPGATSAKGGVWDGVILQTQRGAAFCREAEHSSVLCVDVSTQALHRTPLPVLATHLVLRWVNKLRLE